MFRAKNQQMYWYTDFDEQGRWHYLERRNVNAWEDQYNFSMGNCYASQAEAEDDLYRLKALVLGED